MSEIINTNEYLVGNIYSEFEIPINENDCLHTVEVLPQLYLIKKNEDGSFLVCKEHGSKKVKSLNEIHGASDCEYELYPLCSYHTVNAGLDSFIYDEDGKRFEDSKLKDVFERQKRKNGRIMGVGYYTSLKDFLKNKYGYEDDTISLEMVQLYIMKYNIKRSGKAILLNEDVASSLKELQDSGIFFDTNVSEDYFKQNDSNIVSSIKKS